FTRPASRHMRRLDAPPTVSPGGHNEPDPGASLPDGGAVQRADAEDRRGAMARGRVEMRGHRRLFLRHLYDDIRARAGQAVAQADLRFPRAAGPPGAAGRVPDELRPAPAVLGPLLRHVGRDVVR